MGGGRWTEDDWISYQTTNNVAQKTTAQVFSSTSLKKSLSPLNSIRESVDSDDNPNSTPIILSIDVTGSMGHLADAIVRHGLNTLCKEIYSRKPVTDPHVLIAAVGDLYTDSTPFQITQFEADIRIADQLKDIYLEGGGGGNGSESYALTWWFAANRTKCDSFAKRGKKGYIFTVGDDGPTPELTESQLKAIFGNDVLVKPSSMKDLLTQVSREWEVFHLLLTEGTTHSPRVHEAWKELLGERALILTDHSKLAEVIVSTIQVNEGVSSVADVSKSWSGNTSLVVASALKNLTPTVKSTNSSNGIVVL